MLIICYKCQNVPSYSSAAFVNEKVWVGLDNQHPFTIAQQQVHVSIII